MGVRNGRGKRRNRVGRGWKGWLGFRKRPALDWCAGIARAESWRASRQKPAWDYYCSRVISSRWVPDQECDLGSTGGVADEG